ncbi:MAG TPA: hypothetical protein VFC46_15320 [Humisphaera sp.]|nr:hypothetical protein [Humisphaera sp.]
MANVTLRDDTLDRMVRIKLTAFRTKDRMHLLDMLDLGMIDAAWCDRFPAVLAERLRELIQNPR